jgi:23S rRNA (guanine2445-N2)-methyltransferase / 23S rRNA (guanine2069-N7)-methyltransferase
LQFLASVPRGFADLLQLELAGFGATDLKERGNAVAFTGELAVAYRGCLESRLASRVFLELARFDAPDEAAIYRALRAVDWNAVIVPGATLACEWSGRHPAIVNTHFGTLRLKDAICDALRDATGSRPDIALREPGLRVHAHATGTRVVLSLDLAGEGLHRRGWRTEAGEAPLRENVAAGVLIRAGWPAAAALGARFLDPMCGSGTLVIEAALIAAAHAPGLLRDYFGFLGWRGHDAALWQQLRADAQARATAGLAAALERGSLLAGRDVAAGAVQAARRNAERAGVAVLVHFETGALADAKPPSVADGAALDAGAAPGAGGVASSAVAGLLCTNPPYGVRLADPAAARAIHEQLGAVLRERFGGWQAAILTSAEFGLELGLRAARVHTVWNGAIECRLLRLDIDAASVRDLRPQRVSGVDAALKDAPGARMFANRLTKNLRNLGAWARREQVDCYRIYDADMPEYALAIDLYGGVSDGAGSGGGVPDGRAADAAPEPERWLYVQEYAAPREIPEEDTRRRRSEALAALLDVTGVPGSHLHLRTRRRTARGDQYDKLDSRAAFHVVAEQGLRFWVNFTDYLDTGLFLDHRITRARLRAAAAGARFLNLFGYTGSATVYAASGGARTTTTVDLSNTYLDWAARNLALNGLAGPQHQFVQADVRRWLLEGPGGGRFDLIFLDPPTFSNSKRMDGVLDVQRDHVELVERCVALLAPGGRLVFSTNAQRFRLDPALAGRYTVRDISRATLPKDFERNARIHQCFEIGQGP